MVDFLINSAQHEQNAIISRCHAKVVRDEGNVHEIIDSSRNGIFINDIKMRGKFRTFLGDGFDFLVLEFFVSKYKKITIVYCGPCAIFILHYVI